MQRIQPCLWFDNQAEEATKHYCNIFKNSKCGAIARYSEAGAAVSGRAVGSVMTVVFQLCGQDFLALNGGPIYKFTPATSLDVSCETEEEIDHLFNSLSDGGQVLMPLSSYPFSKKFAWISDKYGLSWRFNLNGESQSIRPALMFVGDQHGRAEEALNFYVSKFENSSISGIWHYEAGEPDKEGTVKHSSFSLDGCGMIAMDSGHPHNFAFTPALSFMVNCISQEEVDHFWTALCEGGAPNHCGWLSDKFGVSWQIVPTVLSKMMQDSDCNKSKKVFEAMLTMSKLDIAALEKAYLS
ncbi:MAG: VOC family protein [Candidatus Obscuribacterales bacterium]|nr:VOC family protein [Candidatus Obscuribacterales bacterium]